MNKHALYLAEILHELRAASTLEKAQSSRRYFPNGINCIGANASDINAIIGKFQSVHNELSALQMLSFTEYLLKNSEFSEQILIAYGLINKFVKNNYDDDLLFRFEFWLENYATNWAQVDDLCIKTIYKFLLARPHMIEKTQHWAHSDVSWCRRASNVVWVKFIKRKIGNSTYYLDKRLIFKNCDLLLDDRDEFVQKSIGWLLKVSSLEHEVEVIEYIKNNYQNMQRSTLRYALEKVDKNQRKELLSLIQ